MSNSFLEFDIEDPETVELTLKPSQNHDDADNKKRKEIKAAETANAEKKKKYKRLFFMRILARLIMISIGVTLIVALKINLHHHLRWVLDKMDATFGSTWSPVTFCILFSIWTSLSPMGYLPTVLCGIFFKWYIAPIVAYISVNIGSIMNVLLIRYVILKYKDKWCCIKRTLTCCCGKKMGQVSFLKKLFIASSPIKTIILLRLPYLNNGVLNYLFSLQIDTVTIKDNIIGNLVGFIPGSILFSIFGAQMKSITKVISNGGFDNKLQMILFIAILVLSICCYICIAWKVKKVIKKGTGGAEREKAMNVESIDDDDTKS